MWFKFMQRPKGWNMRSNSLIAIAVMAAAFAAAVPANSQPGMPGFNRGPLPPGPGNRPPPPGAVNREAEMIGLHQLCDRGDRQACIRFGFLLGQAQDRHAEWRRSHADWWAWERR
jgi:hypothetical protein